MLIRGVKPQAQWRLDALLFGLLALVMLSALMQHTGGPGATHARFMWHMLHGIAGVAMGLTLAVHLLVHLPWIRSQLARSLGRQPRAITRLPQ